MKGKSKMKKTLILASCLGALDVENSFVAANDNRKEQRTDTTSNTRVPSKRKTNVVATSTTDPADEPNS